MTTITNQWSDNEVNIPLGWCEEFGGVVNYIISDSPEDPEVSIALCLCVVAIVTSSVYVTWSLNP